MVPVEVKLTVLLPDVLVVTFAPRLKLLLVPPVTSVILPVPALMACAVLNAPLLFVTLMLPLVVLIPLTLPTVPILIAVLLPGLFTNVKVSLFVERLAANVLTLLLPPNVTLPLDVTLNPLAVMVPVSVMSPLVFVKTKLPTALETPAILNACPFVKLMSPLVALVPLKLLTLFAFASVVPPTELVVNNAPLIVPTPVSCTNPAVPVNDTLPVLIKLPAAMVTLCPAVNEMPPVVVLMLLPMEISFVAPVSVALKAFNALPPPITPFKAIAPLPEEMVRLCVPAALSLTALSVRLPFVVVKLILPASVKLPPMLNVSPAVFVVMLLAKLTLPDVEKLPVVTEIGLLAATVKRPELVMAKLPAVVVKLLLKLNAVPLSVAEPTLTVLPNVVAPVAALVCVNAPLMAIAPLKLAAAELVTVTAVKPVVSALVPEP